LVAVCFASCCAGVKSVRVEDVMPIATGHEREELEADLQVRRTVLLLRGSVDSVLENGF
jgi:hypothetical protein